MTDKTKALILFSGGQDSATCLAWALDRYDYVETVGFNYEQRHSIEMDDCRIETLNAQMMAITLGMDKIYKLETPLMNLSKAGAWDLAEKLGGQKLIDIIKEDSHTCYKGERGERYDWGFGCGTCPACELRAKGWAEYAA